MEINSLILARIRVVKNRIAPIWYIDKPLRLPILGIIIILFVAGYMIENNFDNAERIKFAQAFLPFWLVTVFALGRMMRLEDDTGGEERKVK